MLSIKNYLLPLPNGDENIANMVVTNYIAQFLLR